MPPETEVIACPACRHLLRVPLDWLGQTVQCPECRATFAAPVRTAAGLSDPVLIAAAPAGPAARPPRADLMLMLPAFGLMFVGVAALVVNAALFVSFTFNPDAGAEWMRNVARQMRADPAADPAGGEGSAEEQKQTEDAFAGLAPALRWVWPVAAAAGGLTLAGGVAMACRRGYRLAVAGCVVAALNLPHMCCVPGAVVGLWGLFMLVGAEGRAHFGRA